VSAAKNPSPKEYSSRNRQVQAGFNVFGSLGRMHKTHDLLIPESVALRLGTHGSIGPIFEFPSHDRQVDAFAYNVLWCG